MLKNRRKLLLILIDIAIFTGVYTFCALMAWFAAPTNYVLDLPHQLLNYAAFLLSVMFARWFLRVYRNVWRYADTLAYFEMMVSDLTGGIIALTISYFTKSTKHSIYIGFWCTVAVMSMAYIATLTSRLLYQQYHKNKSTDSNRGKSKTNVAIVGAGQIGTLLVEELERNPNSTLTPVCFIDTDKGKVGGFLQGLPIYAPDDDLVEKMKKLSISDVIIALPRMSMEGKKRIFDYYIRLNFKVKIYDFPFTDDEEAPPKERVIKDVKIEDLLFRDSIKVFDKTSRSFYTDKTVVVTGGGGSIGSELCRQIAKCNPKKLIIFDIYENNAYDIQQELIRKYGEKLDLVVEIGSVRDRARLEAVFAYYRPDLVFHAAAHKHVPLMEHSNCEAIKNNCLGTYNTADMAEKYGASKFILISTDKAVNPTNVMGASKRMCEMIIQCRLDSKTEFAAVRFGNVLGSNGSVIPLFRSQIANGGPLTITDKRIIRYFMTIPEAAGLVLSAGAMAKCGDLFVLDMGKPVKILDLAENMIRLSGFRPYIDIDIKEIGLRPGEKLYEELLIKTENLSKTDNDLIFIEHDTPFSRAEVNDKIDVLRRAIADAEREIGAKSITDAMKSVVPTFMSPEEVNAKAAASEEMQLVESNASTK